ncbi:hypothetical protein FEK66_24260 [Escherichia sp. E1130]|nr:hypothetical protein FEK66_24260 [Escherichia sp. E1130]
MSTRKMKYYCFCSSAGGGITPSRSAESGYAIPGGLTIKGSEPMLALFFICSYRDSGSMECKPERINASRACFSFAVNLSRKTG